MKKALPVVSDRVFISKDSESINASNSNILSIPIT